MSKGAHRGKNQPVPLRGIKTFCYEAPEVCPDFRGRAKKQPVPWHSGTGLMGALAHEKVDLLKFQPTAS